MYLKTIDLSKVNNKENFNEGFIIFIVLDVISAIVFLTSIAIYLYWFLPFKNADGEIITVKITERNRTQPAGLISGVLFPSAFPDSAGNRCQQSYTVKRCNRCL